MKGTGAMALKANASRRRTKAEIREAKLAESAKKADVEAKLKELEQLKQAHEVNSVAMSNAEKTVNYLLQEGLLKQTGVEGEVVPVLDFEEF